MSERNAVVIVSGGAAVSPFTTPSSRVTPEMQRSCGVPQDIRARGRQSSARRVMASVSFPRLSEPSARRRSVLAKGKT